MAWSWPMACGISTSGATAYGARAAGARERGTPASGNDDGAVRWRRRVMAPSGQLPSSQTTPTAGNVAVTTRGVGSEGATARNAARLGRERWFRGQRRAMTPWACSNGGLWANLTRVARSIRMRRIIPCASVGGVSLAATGVTVNSKRHRVAWRSWCVATVCWSLVDSTVTASGAGANAVAIRSGRRRGHADRCGLTLVSQQGAVQYQGRTGDDERVDDNVIIAWQRRAVQRHGWRHAEPESPTLASSLTGAAPTEAGSTSNLVLRDSTWNLTGDSCGPADAQQHPSQTLFSAPVGKVFKTPTVGQYSGDGGSPGSTPIWVAMARHRTSW